MGQPGIALRADASPVSGTGHVVRCLSLGFALREAGARVCLVSRSPGIDVESMARRVGVDWLPLPVAGDGGAQGVRGPSAEAVDYSGWAGVPWDVDANETAHRLAEWGCSRVVVDHYALDARWHGRVAGLIRMPVAAIDDLANRDLDVDWLIDQNLGDDARGKYGRHIGEQTRVLAGPRYALLGPRYATLAPRVLGDRVRSVGIFLGGVDAAGLSELALRACRQVAGFKGDIEIATTRANPHLGRLRELAQATPRTTLLIDQPDLAGFFGRHDLQIGAGGSATWERCCAGAPMVLLVAAPNQEAVVPPMVARGAAVSPGLAGSRDLRRVGGMVAELLADGPRRRSLGARARELVDGLGARRVALALLRETLTLRPARGDDAKQVYPWRNHPATRGVSRDAREIALDDHVAWWSRALADSRKRLYLARVGPVDVGVLRLDIEGDGAEVSVYLDPDVTGLGLGPFMLRAAQEEAVHRLNLQALRAHIRPGNRASERAFDAVGFRRGAPFWTWSVRDHAISSTESVS